MVKHIELTDDDMSGVASVILEKAGWVGKEVDNQILWSLPTAFDCHGLIWQDAMQIQQMIDAWGNHDKTNG